MEFVIYIMAILMLFIGWLGAYISYRNKLNIVKSQLADEYDAGFTDGRNEVLRDPKQIEKAYMYHYQRRP